MQRLEVSGAVQPLQSSLGVKRLSQTISWQLLAAFPVQLKAFNGKTFMTKSDFVTKWRYFQPAVTKDTQKRSIPMLCSSSFHKSSVSMEDIHEPWSHIVERIRRTQAKRTKWHKPLRTGFQRGMTSCSVQPIGRGSIHKLNSLSHYYVILSRML